MRTRRALTVAFAVAALALAAAVWSAEPTPKPDEAVPPDQPWRTSFPVQITWSPPEMLDVKTISTVLGRDIGAEVRFIPWATSPRVVSQGASLRGVLQVGWELAEVINNADSKRGAEALAAVLERINKALAADFDAAVGQIDNELRRAAKRKEEAYRRLMQLSEEMRAGQRDLQARNLQNAEERLKDGRAQLSQSERRLAELQMESAGKRARLEAALKQIAELGHQKGQSTELAPGGDPIAVDLAKIVKIRQKELDMTRQLHDAGKAGALEMGDAERKLAEARIALATRLEAVFRSEGGFELLAKLKAEQSSLMLDLAEMEAHEQMAIREIGQIEADVHQLQRGSEQAAEILHRIKRLEKVDLPLVGGQANESALALHRLQERRDQLEPPKVTILRGLE